MKKGWVEFWHLPSGFEYRFNSPNGSVMVRSNKFSTRQARLRGFVSFCDQFKIPNDIEIRHLGDTTQGEKS